MALVICGDVDLDRTLAVIDGLIGEASPCEPVRRYYPEERGGSYKSQVEMKMTVERPLFCIGFKDSGAPTDPLLRRKRQITAEILTGVIFSSSNPLFSSLFKRGIMTSPFGYGEEYGKSYAFCWASGECDNPTTVHSEIIAYIENLKKHGIDRADFDRRKKMIYASDIKMYDSTWDIANSIFDNAFTGVDIFDESEILKSITCEDANTLLCEMFRESNMTCSLILPNE